MAVLAQPLPEQFTENTCLSEECCQLKVHTPHVLFALCFSLCCMGLSLMSKQRETLQQPQSGFCRELVLVLMGLQLCCKCPVSNSGVGKKDSTPVVAQSIMARNLQFICLKIPKQMKHNCQTETSNETEFQDRQDSPCNLSGYAQRRGCVPQNPSLWELCCF